VAGISFWVEWVPSKANIADFPSRGDFDLLTQLGAEQRPFILPTFAAWDEPFAKRADWGEGQDENARRVSLPPRLGSIGIGHVQHDLSGKVSLRDQDVLVDRSTPLGNPCPIDLLTGASRPLVCDACAEVFINETAVEEISTKSSSGSQLGTAAEFLGADAHRARWSAIDVLASRVAGGECIRLVCWRAPRRCHASSVAACVRNRAREVLAGAGERRGRQSEGQSVERGR